MIVVFLVMILNFVCTACFAKTPTALQKKLAALEASSGGRIGVSAVNTGNHRQIQYRAHERFPMGCTSKVMGVAAILKKSMTDPSLLQQKIAYSKNDLTQWSPITQNHLHDAMTIADLSAAAISFSDNTAMNLLVKKLGGLQAINAFARSINDHTFRQDHDWPREALSGGRNNVYDSSTPAAMEKSFQRIALGDVLAGPQCQLLLRWLKQTHTGNDRIRAGVPKNWIVGDKTGTGVYYGTTNDIAILWPPKCAPIIVAIYYTSDQKTAVKRDDIIASVTRALLNEFAEIDSCLRLSF